MTPQEIRELVNNGEAKGHDVEFGLALLKELVTQVAELNETLRTPQYYPSEQVEDCRR